MSVWKTFVCLLPFQLMFGMVYAWGSIAPVIQHETGWPIASLDLMFSLTPLTLFPAVLVSGRLVGRYPPEHVLALAYLCFVVGALFGLTSGSLWTFALGYSCLALGVGGGLSTPASIEIIRRATSTARGRLAGALLAVYCVSATFSVPLFLQLVQSHPWRMAIGATMAAWSIPGGVALAVLLGQRTPSVMPREVKASLAERTALRPVAWNIGLLFACVPFGSASFAALGRLAISHGSGAWESATGTAVISLANGIGRFAGGALTEVASLIRTVCRDF